VFDLGELSDVIREEVLDDVDHRTSTSRCRGSTAASRRRRSSADAIWERLDRRLPDGLLYEVVVRETEKNWASRRPRQVNDTIGLEKPSGLRRPSRSCGDYRPEDLSVLTPQEWDRWIRPFGVGPADVDGARRAWPSIRRALAWELL
jgi:hypothetical protein